MYFEQTVSRHNLFHWNIQMTDVARVCFLITRYISNLILTYWGGIMFGIITNIPVSNEKEEGEVPITKASASK